MTKTLTILIIDDSEDDRTLYRRALSKNSNGDFAFVEAEDGAEGLTCAERALPDCVLLDYSLPGHDGIEVLKRIRAKHAFVPVVVLTGQGNETVAVAAMKEGAQDYIAKSMITPEALERVIRVAIDHATLEQRIHEQRTSLEIFTHALAHDLKEPTNTILSFVELILASESLSHKATGYFSHIHKAATRMRQLIDTVHLYTRIDMTEQMVRELCSVAGVLEDAKENLGQLIRDEKATITYDALPEIFANKTQLLQVLQNLLANAIRHGGSGVTIYVGAEDRAEHWRIYVRDDGPGVDPAHVEKIFDPFKRMSNSKVRGLGLGLAISRKIVESHGGRIWCESTPGAGATFSFTLPKSVAEPAAYVFSATGKAMPKPMGSDKDVARILLVDDNEADIMLNRIMLIDKGRLQCETLTAIDGQDALDKLREAAQQNNPFDLVLLDINMPVMSGFELMAHMQKESMLHHTSVVMCSTSAYDIDKRMATSMGAAGYLLKPPQFDVFKNIIDKAPNLRLEREGDKYTLRRAA